MIDKNCCTWSTVFGSVALDRHLNSYCCTWSTLKWTLLHLIDKGFTEVVHLIDTFYYCRVVSIKCTTHRNCLSSATGMFCLSIKSHSYYSDVDQVQQENFDQVQHLQKDVDQVQHLVFDQVQHLVFDQVQPAPFFIRKERSRRILVYEYVFFLKWWLKLKNISLQSIRIILTWFR